MQALVYAGPGTMVLEERVAPTPGPGDVILSVASAGICGSDIHGYTGASGRRTPGIVMGHEIAGDVVAAGANVDRALLGRSFVICPLLTCGMCPYCQAGMEQLCAKRSYVGIGQDGGFAEMVRVPAASLVSIPTGLDPAIASLAEPTAVAMHAVDRAPDLRGASILVTGAGPIGLLIARVATAAGSAARVVNTEISPARRAVATELGLEVVDPSADDWLDELRESPDDGFDVVFEAVGIQPTFESALAAVRRRGCLVLAAGWQTVTLTLGALVTREIETRGTFNFSRSEFEDAVAFLARSDVAGMVNERVSLADAAAAFERLAADQGASVKTVIMP